MSASSSNRMPSSRSREASPERCDLSSTPKMPVSCNPTCAECSSAPAYRRAQLARIGRAQARWPLSRPCPRSSHLQPFAGFRLLVPSVRPIPPPVDYCRALRVARRAPRARPGHEVPVEFGQQPSVAEYIEEDERACIAKTAGSFSEAGAEEELTRELASGIPSRSKRLKNKRT